MIDTINNHKNNPEFCRNMLYGIMKECPLQKDCNINKEEICFKEKIKKIKNLSDQECVDLYQEHLNCFMKKN